MNVLNQMINDRYALYQGDCVDVVKGIPDNGIHYTIFSPPFASLYTYSSSDRDMGNSKDGEEFQKHFEFLINELYRITMPGRLVSVHCMNLPAMKSRDGFIGVKDFRGDIIRQFINAGFIFHSEVCIWKNPVTEMQRTKALGLLHKQIRKDSAMCRQGLPDYLVTFRKPGENPEPIPHTHETFPVNVWQRYASPVWMDIRQSNTLQRKSARDEKDEKHICFATGTLVLSKRGYVPIESLEVGIDEVLTHTGSWKKVIAKAQTGVSVPVVKTNAVGVPNLISTPDHKLLCKQSYGKRQKENLNRCNEEWKPAIECNTKTYLKSILPPIQESNIPEKEWWIIGRWLADGHIDSRGHQYFISVGSDKWNKFTSIADNYIGAVSDHGNCKQVGLVNLSKETRSFLSRCTGKAHEKVVPFEGISLSKKLSEVFLDGYLSGDGCTLKSGKIMASSVSRSLLLSMAIVAQRVFERVPAIYEGRNERQCVIEGREVNARQEWNMTISPHHSFCSIDGAETWKKVRKSSDAGFSDVWSIEVDEDHTYTAEGCIVKNCPLQLDVIERGIDLWTNPGDIVLDPFAGIGSVPYQALLMDRRAIGIELKDTYFNQMKSNMEQVEEETAQLTLDLDTNVLLRCPICGVKVPGGESNCKNCGYEIRT